MLYIREIIVIITIYTNQLTILLLVKWATRLDHLPGDSNNNNNNNNNDNNNNKENGTSVIPLSKYRLNTQLIPLANCFYFLNFILFFFGFRSSFPSSICCTSQFSVSKSYGSPGVSYLR